MQPTRFLFSAIRHVCQNIHLTRFNCLRAATDALLDGKKLSLVSLGRRLNSKVDTKHNIKRIDRLLGNRKLNSERRFIYRAIAKLVCGGNKQPVVVADWSGLTRCGKYLMLRAAIPVGGRAIPIYEEAHLEKDYDSRKTNSQFLINLKEILPSDCRPIVVTDAGFRNTWFKTIESFGWHWIGRVRNKTLFRWHGLKEWAPIKQLYSKAILIPKFLGRVELAKTNPHICNFFLYKGKRKHRRHTNLRGHRVRCSVSLKHARREREPWLLATSLDYSHGLEKKIIKIYKTRMQIEESFRDIKNPRYGFSLSETRSKHRHRFNVLLLIGTLASLAAWLMGKIAHSQKRQYQFQANTIKDRDVLSMFFLGCEVYKKGIVFQVDNFINAVHELRDAAVYQC
jgi:hypothetical protein